MQHSVQAKPLPRLPPRRPDQATKGYHETLFGPNRSSFRRAKIRRNGVDQPVN